MLMIPATNTSAATATAAAAGSSCSSNSAKLKGAMLHQQQHGVAAAAAAAAALKCPRCDSSNTKFCYYNNYSLSQPRHFCKACKRYWTRGGTLRNVPVGGGCRKNKRVRKSSHHQQSPSTAAADLALQQLPPPQSSSLASNLFTSAAANDLSSLLYSDMNLAAFSTASTAAYDAVGLGGLIPSDQLSAAGLINSNLADLHQPGAATFLNNDYSISFGSQAASLLVSSLKQPKKAEEYQSTLLPYDTSASLGFPKDVKVEGDKNSMSNNNISITEWQASYQSEANGASDASYLYWNSAMAMDGAGGGWPDTASPSIAPLI